MLAVPRTQLVEDTQRSGEDVGAFDGEVVFEEEKCLAQSEAGDSGLVQGEKGTGVADVDVPGFFVDVDWGRGVTRGAGDVRGFGVGYPDPVFEGAEHVALNVGEEAFGEEVGGGCSGGDGYSWRGKSPYVCAGRAA